MNKQLTVTFSIVLLLTVTVVASVDFLQTANATKAQGTSLPETGSKKVCGDKLCSEVDQSESTKTKHGESSHEDKGKHGAKKSAPLLSNQVMSGKYKITVDWIHEFPVTGESNGFAILVSDTSVKAEHGKDKGKHGESSHEDKGDCRCITLLKSSVPKAELFENGVSGLENKLKITVSTSNQEMIMPLSVDELNGRYYALFVPTTSGEYDVKLSGMISGVSVNHTFQPDSVLEKSELLQFP